MENNKSSLPANLNISIPDCTLDGEFNILDCIGAINLMNFYGSYTTLGSCVSFMIQRLTNPSLSK